MRSRHLFFCLISPLALTLLPATAAQHNERDASNVLLPPILPGPQEPLVLDPSEPAELEFVRTLIAYASCCIIADMYTDTEAHLSPRHTQTSTLASPTRHTEGCRDLGDFGGLWRACTSAGVEGEAEAASDTALSRQTGGDDRCAAGCRARTRECAGFGSFCLDCG